jgi:hypothetical protein
MRPSPALALNKTADLAQPRLVLPTLVRSREQGLLPFLCLAGFVATQGYLIPVTALPLNWAVWPSLPDLFGLGLVAGVTLLPHRTQLTAFNRGMLKDLLWMGLIFSFNFLFVTIPFSSTGEGIRYGGYSLILFTKYVGVYWAAAHVRIDQNRLRILHIAALTALLWVSLTTLADRFYLIEIDDFTRHLPSASAGKWDVSIVGLDSTASNSHGGTTVVILILGALVVATAQHRFAWLVEGAVFGLGMGSSFISGSRQGLVRMIAFIATYFAKKPARYIVLMLVFLVLVILLFSLWSNPLSEIDNPYYLEALQRQEALRTDPFSNESLAGRPELWQSVIDTLNDSPIRWLIGYGMGNYVEYENAAHNMLLQLLQDGGIIELILISILWIRIFRRIWASRQEAWTLVSLTVAMLTSVFTSAIFYPNLATGWYLGLYFVTMHLVVGGHHASEPDLIGPPSNRILRQV